ncbi:MAG: hypothetical protein JOY78_07685 [Pseudonocardia sp.]|nr:hypothetical protein [Pseudonocardia sp.]
MRRFVLVMAAIWFGVAGLAAGPSGASGAGTAAPSLGAAHPVSTAFSRFADKNQLSTSVAFGGGRYLLVWEDTRAGHADQIWGARLSATGALLDPSGIQISPTATSADADAASPAVSYDGTSFLVVWTTNGNVLGARVSTAGAVLDPSAFAISTAAGAQIAPAVASNGGGSLVVWQDGRSGTDDIYGARVDQDGHVLETGGIAVSTATKGQSSPAVTFDGARYFAVWEDARGASTDIFGARVSTAGAVLDAAGIKVAGGSSIQGLPGVGSNGHGSFVAWQQAAPPSPDVTPPADIRGTRVAQNGTVLDPSGITVGAAVRDQFEPVVAFDGTDYLVAWTDLRTGPFFENTDIYASRVTTAGVNRDGNGFPVSNPDFGQFAPAIASNGSTALVAWTDQRTTDFDVRASRVTSAASVLDPSGIVVTRAASVQSEPAVAFDGTNFLVAWVEDRTLDSHVFVGRVSRNGTALDGGGIDLGLGSDPAVAFDGTNFFVTWEHPSQGILGARFDTSGHRLDATSIAIGDGSTPSIAFNGTSYLVVFERSGESPNFDDVIAARVNRAGTVLDRFTVAGANAFEDQPTVASDGSGFLVAWRLSTASFNVVRARRVSGNGALLGTGPIALAPATTDQDSPGAAFAGGRYLVVWTERRAEPRGLDVFGSLLTSAGAAVGTKGFTVSAAPGDQDEPAVAGSANFLVAWTDRRSSTDSDVNGGRIQPDGTRLDGDGAALAAGPADEEEPAVSAGPSSDDPFGITYQRFAPESPFGAPRVFLRTSPK